MAEQKVLINGGFFDSINGDRKYAASEMNRPYKRVINEGVFATPQGTPSTDLQVLSANNQMNIIVKKGEGLLGGRWFENPSDIAITVSNNTQIVPRRDSIIIQVDLRQSGRIVNVVYREGTPNSNPMPPDINTVENVIEKRVANIYVAPGANYIGQDAITDLRGSSECPWVTSLIKQVDTSTLFAQFSKAYWDFYNTTKADWDEFMAEISDTFKPIVNTNIVTYESHYTTTTDGETSIPVNITNFNPDKDVLMVRINHLFASETTDYTVAIDGSTITLTKDLKANQNVDFLVLQSVIVGDTETVLVELQKLATVVDTLKSDSGWVNFTLENNIQAYSDGLTPGYRKYNNQVFLRGCVKNVATNGTVIATLPTGYRPAMTRYYTIATASITATIEIGTNGQVKLANVIGTLATSSLIPIDTSFIVD